MRLKHLRLAHFRGFEDLDLDLNYPVTMLVGPNGSGKSSLLLAIACAYSVKNQPVGKDGLALIPSEEDLKEGATTGKFWRLSRLEPSR